ncbi:MAG: ribonuclease HII [Micrococcales bacterium]|nr:ribonuclease HII [Micrococcales bacterium]
MSSKTSQLPSLDFEATFATRGVRYIIGMDEVGRGCIAGEVAVGAALIDLEQRVSWPEGLRDSKLLSEKARNDLFPKLIDFVAGYSVGLASVAEIEEQGIIKALGLAGSRAIQGLLDQPELVRVVTAAPVQLILDGNIDYLGTKSFGFPVVTKVQADRDCVSVSAASVLAKVTRDDLMLKLAKSYPGYGLDKNKGYASAQHRRAIIELGPTQIHRLSWLGKILQG